MVTQEHLNQTNSDFADFIKDEMKNKFKPRQINIVLGYDNKKRKIKKPWCSDQLTITKTYLQNFDPVKPHFYTVKMGFTRGIHYFLISAQKHRFWVLIRTASPKYEKYQSFLI